MSINLDELETRAESAEMVTWQNRDALRLENGLALFNDLRMADGRVEVLIGTDGPAYPGLAFRVVDQHNYELAYAVPHASGLWDAIQYDPVFHGSNTWQLHHGPAYQQSATVPVGRWFRLGIGFSHNRAAISVDDQLPLVVEKLSRPIVPGRIGLWTFLPAFFADLRATPGHGLGRLSHQPGIASPATEAVDGWLAENYGVVQCEETGILNVNRYFPLRLKTIRLTRRFELSQAGTVAFSFGFSDVLSLELDGEGVWSGETAFRESPDRAARGYVEAEGHTMEKAVAAGIHRLTAELEVKEAFGWGLSLTARGTGLNWLPVERG